MNTKFDFEFLFQASRDERSASSPGSQIITPTPSPSPVGDAPLGRALMEQAIQQASSGSQKPPLVVTPPGYWVDGTDHRHALNSTGRALLPAQPAWQPRIDQDDTAKCYRRFFVGRVRKYQFYFFFVFNQVHIFCLQISKTLVH